MDPIRKTLFHRLTTEAKDRSRGKPIGRNTRLMFCTVTGLDEENSAAVLAWGVKLHNTFVVVYLPNDEVLVSNGGWATQTTADRINNCSPSWLPLVNWHPGRKADRDRYCSDGWMTHASSSLSWAVVEGYTPPKKTWCRDCKGTDRLCPTCRGHNQVEVGLQPIHMGFPRNVDFLWKPGLEEPRRFNKHDLLVREYNWYDFRPESARVELDSIISRNG